MLVFQSTEDSHHDVAKSNTGIPSIKIQSPGFPPIFLDVSETYILELLKHC